MSKTYKTVIYKIYKTTTEVVVLIDHLLLNSNIKNYHKAIFSNNKFMINL
jgi:hypothetical protein